MPPRNQERWIDWLPTLEPHEQVTHAEANWTSCTAFCGGIESEAARLRPLLERCLDMLVVGCSDEEHVAVVADLRRELGKEG